MRKLVYVIGMGPGNFEQMTFEARRALEQSDVIVGYTVYVDLLREHFPDKQFLTTPMRQEVERCRMAFEEAGQGKTVAMVCSGDAGVYGMSGLILELQQEYSECDVEVVSGVTAALAGGAVLGPGRRSRQDFAVRRRRIFPSVSTIRPVKSGRIIYRRPVILFWNRRRETGSAAL